MTKRLLAHTTAWHAASNSTVALSLLSAELSNQPCQVSSGGHSALACSAGAAGTMSRPAVVSPTKTLTGVLSPSKQMLCSPTRQPLAPCNASRLSLSPACNAKRSLAALQQPQPFSTAAAAGAGGSGALGGSSSAAPKRREQDVSAAAAAGGAPAASLSGGVPAGPHTPAVTQPLAVSHPSGTSSGHYQQQHMRPHLAAGGAGRTSTGALQRSRSSLGVQHHQQHQQLASSAACSATAVDTIAAADQVPSPLAILEFPPELEQVLPGQQQQQPPDSNAAQQQHRPAMSGRRVTARYDIPLGLDWLSGAPDHIPQLGEGRLELIMGPMFAGKTTALINRVRQVSDEEHKLAVAVKSSKDERYGSHWVVTHDGRCMRCYTADSLADFKRIMGPAYYKFQVVAIDEAQFFPDLAEFCSEAVDVDGKHVIVAGLSGDFKRQRFGQLLELMPLADSITQLRSKCAFCEADALFSLRLVDPAGPQALVGGDDKYRATCRRCYLQHTTTMQ